jgi:hypothetical protein
LIAKSIRDIAAENIKNRLRAVNVWVSELVL